MAKRQSEEPAELLAKVVKLVGGKTSSSYMAEKGPSSQVNYQVVKQWEGRQRNGGGVQVSHSLCSREQAGQGPSRTKVTKLASGQASHHGREKTKQPGKLPR